MMRSLQTSEDKKIAFLIYKQLRTENEYLANIALGNFITKIDPLLDRLFEEFSKSFKSNRKELKQEFIVFLVGVLKKRGVTHLKLSLLLLNTIQIFFIKKRRLGDELSISPMLNSYCKKLGEVEGLLLNILFEESDYCGEGLTNLIHEIFPNFMLND